MSTTAVPSPNHTTNLHIRYAIAITSAILILISILFFTLYLLFRCFRRFRRHRNPHPPRSPTVSGIIVPRVFFVAEEDTDDSENVAVGLDQAVINSYPRFPYSKGVGSDSVCAICLCEYKDAEMLRMLPDCRHAFHLTCVDAWLKLNASCPVCRNSPLPTPLSTPLAEVVPLSQYADGRRR